MNKTETNINLFHDTISAMNTRLDCLWWGVDALKSKQVFSLIETEIKKLELLLSCYNPNSETYQLNQNAFEKEFHVSDALFQFIVLGMHYYKASLGFFNIALGGLFKQLKAGVKLHQVSEIGLESLLLLNSESQTIKFAKDYVSLDFGGIGKGIALQAIATILLKEKVFNAFISFGGSSILTRGHHPHGAFWPFALSDMDEDISLELRNDSVSVSGAIVDSGKGAKNHILNPVKLEQVETSKIAVVKADNPVDAEVLSTCLIAAPIEMQKVICMNFNYTQKWCRTK